MSPVQVVQAVRNEQKAKEVATAVDAVSEAARNIGSTQQDASALSEEALQAAAALSALNDTAGLLTDPKAEQSARGSSGTRSDWDREQAESKSFALGKCNAITMVEIKVIRFAFEGARYFGGDSFCRLGGVCPERLCDVKQQVL